MLLANFNGKEHLREVAASRGFLAAARLSCNIMLHVQHDVCNCFTVKVSVSNFKAEKSENLDNAFAAFYVFTFFDVPLQKRKKSLFWILKKNVKNVFSNYARLELI